MGWKARVHNGRLQLDVPVPLPEGTEVDLVMDDGGDDLDEQERAELHAALDEAWESHKQRRSWSPEEIARQGEAVYQRVLRDQPELLRERFGATIWIDPDSGAYEVQSGLSGARRLLQRVSSARAEHLYSRLIGTLEPAPLGIGE